MGGHRVLLVDDEEVFVEVLAERLEARGLQVQTCTSGEQALEQVAARAYDAILLDLAMPGMGGIETLKRMRSANPDLQIILLTGRATVDASVEAMKLGAVDLLEKPAEIRQLVRKIDEASTRKRELTQKRMDEQLSDILRRKGW
jgi:DNA-binding NtrC family response regulator